MTTLPVCPNRLHHDQKEQFLHQGYLAFSQVLSAAEVATARDLMRQLTQSLCQSPESLYSPSVAKSSKAFSGASYKRPDSPSFLQLEPGFDPEGKSLEELDASVRKYMWFCDEAPLFRQMVSPGSRLHGIVEGLLGPEPVLFQEMALVKPAYVGSEKPWHQDNAYFSVTPLEAVIGVWLALDDATVENGCMHVIPGGQHNGYRHHHGTDCEIAPALLEIDRAIPVPIPAGGALFFYGMLPHQTPPNRSPQRRRALQFHFRGAATRILDEAQYDRLFIDRTGTAASCRAASRWGV